MPGFRCVYVEMTERCNMRCVMCPRHSYAPGTADISLETFGRVWSSMHLCDDVNLSGWGESLLHPHFRDFLAAAAATGARVGFTTNGLLLTEQVAREVLALGVRQITISVDSASPEGYKAIRGVELDRIVTNIRRLIELRKAEGLANPEVYLAYVMMRRNIAEVPEMVRLAAELEVDLIRFSNLNTLSQPEDLEQALFLAKNPTEVAYYQSILEQAQRRATALGVKALFPSLKPSGRTTCQNDPFGSVFVDQDGGVSPCCNLAHPAPRMLGDGQVFMVRPVVFGNVNEAPLEAIYDRQPYRDFRDAFRRGGYPEQCEGCTLMLGV